MINERSSKSEEFNIFSILKIEDANIEQSITKNELESQMMNLVEHLPESQKDIIEKRIFSRFIVQRNRRYGGGIHKYGFGKNALRFD